MPVTADEPADLDQAQHRPVPVAGSAIAKLPPYRPASTTPDGEEIPINNIFRKAGDYWTITYRGAAVTLRDSKGMQYLAELLRCPGREILALDLAAVADTKAGTRARRPRVRANVAQSAITGDSNASVDATARTAYTRRLVELREQLDEANQLNDLGRADRILEEMDVLSAELSRGADPHRARMDPHLERARSAAGKRIRTEIQRIRAVHPALGRHLAATVTTGYACCYRPEPKVEVDWQFSQGASQPTSRRRNPVAKTQAPGRARLPPSRT